MTMQMNNPLLQMVNVIRRGGNPMGVVQQLASRDPAVKQFFRMIEGKSPDQLRQMAENMAKERGVSINDVARQLGITLPSDK